VSLHTPRFKLTNYIFNFNDFDSLATEPPGYKIPKSPCFVVPFQIIIINYSFTVDTYSLHGRHIGFEIGILRVI